MRLFKKEKYEDKKVYSFLGIKITRKRKKKNTQNILDIYKNDYSLSGYHVEKNNTGIFLSKNDFILSGKSDNTLWTGVDVLCKQDYNFNADGDFVMIDIGLNIGLTSLYSAQKDNITKIYGFEPFIPTFEQARQNLQQNPSLAKKIEIFNFGLGDSEKTLDIHYNPQLPGSMSSVSDKFSDCTDVEKIKIKKASEVIGEIIAKHKENIFLKIDCEGAEKEIVPELDKTGLLKKIKIIIMEWHYENPQYLVDILRKNGFTTFCNHAAINYQGMIRAVR